MTYRIYIFISVGLLALAASSALLWRSWISSRYTPTIYAAEQITPARVAIVFGARVYPNGRLSTMLRDRVDTAIQLYKSGKVQKLLVSGDNRFVDYDEPGAMMAYAIQQGVPPADIQPDYGGRRTYDTCYRAQAIFQVKEAILVTQAFHLPRALFVCDQLGVQVRGVAADRHAYAKSALMWSQNRELVALLAAGLDIVRRAPPPVLGPPIPL